MVQDWYFVSRGQRSGPVTHEALASLLTGGELEPRAMVWRTGMSAWTPASDVAELGGTGGVAVAVAPPRKGFLHDVTAQLSDLVDAPTIGDVPIRKILFGGAESNQPKISPEELFAGGSESTTPALTAIPDGWPRVRVAWRILATGLLAFFFLAIAVRTFGGANAIPGLLIIGGFAVPVAIVVLFLELNMPRNVPIYVVLHLLVLGGVVSLIATFTIAELVPGGVSEVVPAFLTGLIEEAAKVVPLLLVLGQRRYRWQSNGLLLGAAVGAGFAGFESAGYALNHSLTAEGAFSVSAVIHMVVLRGVLAPGGHVIWCALVASAIWKVKGDRPFDTGMLVHPTVIKRFAAAVVMHGLWDTDLGNYIPYTSTALWEIPLHMFVLVVVGWYLIFAVMKQSLAEVQAEKQRLLSAA